MGEVGEKSKTKRMVFVTVGTTSFDALVRAVDSEEVKKELVRKGYTHLLIQIGRGSYIPKRCPEEEGSPALDFYTFSSTIEENLKMASLVISHAGSGSIFETLRVGRPLVVVVNEELMDNHQRELADELGRRKHLVCGQAQSLATTIAEMDLDSLVPYPPADATPVAHIIHSYLGFTPDSTH